MWLLKEIRRRRKHTKEQVTEREIDMGITLQQAEALINKYSVTLLRNDDSVKTVVCCVQNRYFTMSIVHKLKAVVFTDHIDDKRIVKFYA